MWSPFCSCQGGFCQTRDIWFYPVPKILTKVTTCCLWSQWYTVQNWLCSKNFGLVILGCSTRYPKKDNSPKIFWLSPKGLETSCCHFFNFFTIFVWRRNVKQKWDLVLQTSWNTAVFRWDKKRWNCEEHWIIVTKRNAFFYHRNFP